MRLYASQIDVALRHPQLIWSWQGHFPQDVSEKLGSALRDRGSRRPVERISRMLLAGCLDEQLTAVARARWGREQHG